MKHLSHLLILFFCISPLVFSDEDTTAGGSDNKKFSLVKPLIYTGSSLVAEMVTFPLFGRPKLLRQLNPGNNQLIYTKLLQEVMNTWSFKPLFTGLQSSLYRTTMVRFTSGAWSYSTQPFIDDNITFRIALASIGGGISGGLGALPESYVAVKNHYGLTHSFLSYIKTIYHLQGWKGFAYRMFPTAIRNAKYDAVYMPIFMLSQQGLVNIEDDKQRAFLSSITGFGSVLLASLINYPSDILGTPIRAMRPEEIVPSPKDFIRKLIRTFHSPLPMIYAGLSFKLLEKGVNGALTSYFFTEGSLHTKIYFDRL